MILSLSKQIDLCLLLLLQQKVEVIVKPCRPRLRAGTQLLLPVLSETESARRSESRTAVSGLSATVGDLPGIFWRKSPGLPASTGPGSQLVYAASWSMGNSSLGTMISGAGGR